MSQGLNAANSQVISDLMNKHSELNHMTHATLIELLSELKNPHKARLVQLNTVNNLRPFGEFVESRDSATQTRAFHSNAVDRKELRRMTAPELLDWIEAMSTVSDSKFAVLSDYAEHIEQANLSGSKFLKLTPLALELVGVSEADVPVFMRCIKQMNCDAKGMRVKERENKEIKSKKERALKQHMIKESESKLDELLVALRQFTKTIGQNSERCLLLETEVCGLNQGLSAKAAEYARDECRRVSDRAAADSIWTRLQKLSGTLQAMQLSSSETETNVEI